MSKDFGPGIFDMGFINVLATQKSLVNAKQAALDRINESVARDDNKAKARVMVDKARSVRDLLFGMTNFSLSHQGLKTIK